MNEKSAVILLSGGLDSATMTAMASRDGFALYGLTFSYGQRHSQEIDSARCIARDWSLRKHVVLPIDLRIFGGSALTSDLDLPRDRSLAEIGAGIPITYVPARNTIFLSFALAWAEVLGVNDIFFGANAQDVSGYPDCRPEFIRAFEALANLATKAAIETSARLAIRTPLMHMTKAEIIRAGLSLGLDYSSTSSCYEPFEDGAACGKCDACVLRLAGFREAGVADPRPYRIEGDREGGASAEP